MNMTGTDEGGLTTNIDEKHIECVIKQTICWPENRTWVSNSADRRIRSFFGAPSSIIAIVWNKIWDRLSPGEKDAVCKRGKPQCQYLLYALVFLKVYSSEEVHCSIVGWPTPKTFRKWSWFFINKISELKEDVIQLEKRFEELPEEDHIKCFISVDGTDCPVFEPWPWAVCLNVVLILLCSPFIRAIFFSSRGEKVDDHPLQCKRHCKGWCFRIYFFGLQVTASCRSITQFHSLVIPNRLNLC